MNHTQKRMAVLSIVAGALTCSFHANAQVTTTPTCTTAPTSIQALSIERTLSLSNISSTLTPNIPSNILAGITSGAQEIRTRLIYNPQQNTITDTTFLVAAGSPIPTPIATDVTGSTIQSFALNISQSYFSCAPTPSVLLVGTLGNANGPYGNFNGALGAISLGYTTDNPAKINNVVEVVAGQIIAYSTSAQGTLTFPAAPVTPPGSNSGAPVINILPNPPASGAVQVYTNPYYLDASGSTDPGGLSLSYAWSSDKPVNFQPANGPKTNAVFQSGTGDYTITLTVTNSAGVVSTKSFMLQYLGQ